MKSQNDLYGERRSLLLVLLIAERERRSTWKDGGKDTPLIKLKQPSSKLIGSRHDDYAWTPSLEVFKLFYGI